MSGAPQALPFNTKTAKDTKTTKGPRPVDGSWKAGDLRGLGGLRV
jgi:hypothetical protein